MAKILIVDDSPSQLYGMQKMVERLGHETVLSENGKDGIRIAMEQLPDLILMDVVMPDMNGFQATRKISKDRRTANIPVIIVTTKELETDRIWGMRQGAKEYLVKPVTEKSLKNAIDANLA